MEAILGLRQAYISQQLMTLRNAGILQDRRDGWNNYYSVICPEIYNVLDAVRQMVGKPVLEPGDLPTTCTCPNCKAEPEKSMNSQFKVSGLINQIKL